MRDGPSETMRLWSSREFLPSGSETRHATILTPFWGRTEAGSAGWPDYADELIRRGREFLDLVELEAADLAVFPLAARRLLRDPDGSAHAKADAFAAVARAAGVPTAFFVEPTDTRGHLDPPFPVPDATVFRTSIFRSRRTPREHAMPGFHDDLLAATGGTLPTRAKDRPVVSFCGSVIPEHPAASGLRRVRRLAGDARRLAWRLQGRHEEDLYARARALDALRAQQDVAASLVVRDSGGAGNWERFDAERWQASRREFVQNMIDSDYVLAVRGDGNWSVRFYEALSLGRVPVVVDTDLVFPYDFLLDWRQYAVWIDRSQIGEIGRHVAEFHERLGEREFRDLQHECRRLWETYLSPLGFFRNFYRHFETR